MSGEIVAGVEPIATTLEAIDWIASVGAFPTELVFREVWNACRRHRVPVGLAPNIEVSIVMTPDDSADLVDDGGVGDRVWRAALGAGRLVAQPLFSSRMRPRSRPALPRR